MARIEEEITRSMFEERENDVKHPTFDTELAFYSLIAEGKLDEVRQSWVTAPKSNAVERGVLSDDNLRNAIYHLVSMTALVSRICINRGLPQDLGYKMSDAFIKKADSQSRVEDVRQVQWEMVETYTNAMKSIKLTKPNSKQIAQCINYIHQNIHKSITVSELAEEVVLNETYLSKLFKKEMGCTVSEYIRNEKIEEACWLLKFTDKTSIEIATDLSFSSHSYFISVFKKVTGTTPKDYRNNHFEHI